MLPEALWEPMPSRERPQLRTAIARELCAFIWALLRNQSCYLLIDEHLKQAA